MLKTFLFKISPLLVSIIFFLTLKITNLGIRLSDTNIYFLTSHEILKGKLLYKDIFFTNFPLFPYLSSIYLVIFNNNLPLFYLTSAIEVSIISILIYYIVNARTKNYLVSITCSLLYLFSFIVLSTSDHQTGVFMASLFAVLSYMFFEKNKFLMSGILIALSFLVKAYFIPIPLAFLLYLFIKKEYRKLVHYFIGFIVVTVMILLPFFVLAPDQILKDVFYYSLTRGAGVVKQNLASFFIFHDFIFFIILIFNLFNFKRNLLFALISLFGIIYFFYYQDIYYLYLNFLIPYLAISFYNFSDFVNQKLKLQKMVLPSIMFIIILINLMIYFSEYRSLQSVPNIKNIADLIKKESPNYIYGTNDIVPALSYLTGIPLLNNIIDTNDNIFLKKLLNAKLLTKDAIDKKSILISHGADYSNIGINQIITDDIFDKEVVKKHCSLLYLYPVITEGIVNRINIFKCF